MLVVEQGICNISITIPLIIIIIIFIIIIIVLVVVIIVIIELTHSKTILENTIQIEPQTIALGFNSLSQYSRHSK